MPGTIIQVFARAPVAGKVKTRLAADIGHRQALRVYRTLLARTLETVAEAGMPAEIWISGSPFHPYLRALTRGRGMPLRIQRGADLGERMWRAIRYGLGRAAAVILIGTDCPGLTPAHLMRARELLAAPDRIVLGPSTDGGYYLIGARRARPGLFRGVEWGTSRVLSQTRCRVRALGLGTRLLPPLTDLDDGSSLARAWNRSTIPATHSACGGVDLTRGRTRRRPPPSG